MLTAEESKDFGAKFIERYLAYGFGSMTKSEIEILIFTFSVNSA